MRRPAGAAVEVAAGVRTSAEAVLISAAVEPASVAAAPSGAAHISVVAVPLVVAVPASAAALSAALISMDDTSAARDLSAGTVLAADPRCRGP
jgi:hypothetical protein